MRFTSVAACGALAAALIVTAPSPSVAAVDQELGVVSWGSGSYGTLGDGTTGDTSTPVGTVGIPDGVTKVSAGPLHSLALTDSGEVWAWGSNTDGQLGDGTRTQRNSPQRVDGLSGVVEVAAGDRFSLAVLADGTVRAWGANQFGQLGIAAGDDRLVPITVPGLTGVTSVAAGGAHSLALRVGGSVWAWGFNHYGQLGDGTFEDRSTPAQVKGITTARQIVAGGLTSTALLPDGRVQAWGFSEWGQIGPNTKEPLPVGISISNVVFIAGRDRHNVAVRGDGTVWAWGYNGNRQVADDPEFRQPVPRRVTGLPPGIVSAAAGRESSLALDSAGQVWAWGWVGGAPYEHHAVPVKVPGLSGATAISAGYWHYHALAPHGFSIGLTPATGTVLPGGSVGTQIRLTPANGYSGTAALHISGLPDGVSVFTTKNEISAAAPVAMALRATTGAQPGTYPITVTATDPGGVIPSQHAVYQLTVSAEGTFSIAFAEPFGTVSPGETASTELVLTPLGAFTGTARLQVLGLPSGISVTLSSRTIGANGPVTVDVHTAPDAPQGTFAVSVSASAGASTSTALYLITITGGTTS
ncbi:hypothetical protein ACFFX1_05800 [Dactylosporangium sucinum]|uniref:RCC1-like domain-containing protein n=1 Tax=Dactylosporangium sucinum TaxID=1424081 RepID=A0A917UEH3_9ACTN|nr:hypothetical protein [Dactylosporangium sucinum]GGM87369.1 hypothetical protein GCM10007977_106650 [Dactylosporangium sucinum]